MARAEACLISRRYLLRTAPAALWPASAAGRKRTAVIVTEYRLDSHADVIAGRLIKGYEYEGKRREPAVHVVSMYTDQVPQNDLSRGLAAKYGFKIYPTVRQALTLDGDKLAVDSVVLIGEHGNYPDNERGQKLYPRYPLYQQIVEVFRASGRSVPVYCDKHFSTDWTKAKQMYDESRELRFPTDGRLLAAGLVATPAARVRSRHANRASGNRVLWGQRGVRISRP